MTVKTLDGCVDSDTMIIYIEKNIDIYVPNIFSPNGDNINDRLLISAGPFVQEIASFVVYDRWGNMVYFSQHFLPNDSNSAWNGMLNGRSLDPAVFTYQMIAVFKDGREETRVGDVTLVK